MDLVGRKLEFLGAFDELFTLQLQLLVFLNNLAHVLVALAQRVLNLVLHGVVATMHVCDLVLEHRVDFTLPLVLPLRILHLLLQLDHVHRKLRLVLLLQHCDLLLEVFVV